MVCTYCNYNALRLFSKKKIIGMDDAAVRGICRSARGSMEGLHVLMELGESGFCCFEISKSTCFYG
jgi:hypothetical protein